jgi:hypothetical protein
LKSNYYDNNSTPKIGLPYRGGNASLKNQKVTEIGLSANKRGTNRKRDQDEDSDSDLDFKDQPEDLDRRKRHQLDEMRPSASKGLNQN